MKFAEEMNDWNMTITPSANRGEIKGLLENFGAAAEMDRGVLFGFMELPCTQESLPVIASELGVDHLISLMPEIASTRILSNGN